MSVRRWTARLTAMVVVAGITSCGDRTSELTTLGPNDGAGDSATKLAVPPAGPVEVLLQVTDAGVPASGVTVAFTPSIAGASGLSARTAVTDTNGEAALTLPNQGLYVAEAVNAAGTRVGGWGSIPCNGGVKSAISLPLRGRAVIHPRGPRLNVLTRNLYLGADVNRLLAPEDPTKQLPVLAAETWGVVQMTNFPERAKAIADEIERARPHLVGLQECALFRIQIPGDMMAGGQTPATEVALDQLAILLAELQARGLDYTAVAIAEGIDIELPMVTGVNDQGVPTFADIRLTDREVILARGGVQVGATIEQQYQAAVPISISGIEMTIPRAYASAEATVAGRTFRFVTTHLETGGVPQVQALQATELLATVLADPLPVVIVGDFNTDAYGTTTDTYGDLIAGGFVDVFDGANPGAIAYTGSQTETLMNSPSTLNRRIDHVFVRGGDGLVPLLAEVVGDEESDRTPSGLWPSDHAGVAASVVLPTANPF